jgi:hypothetical protein
VQPARRPAGDTHTAFRAAVGVARCTGAVMTSSGKEPDWRYTRPGPDAHAESERIHAMRGRGFFTSLPN